LSVTLCIAPLREPGIFLTLPKEMTIMTIFPSRSMTRDMTDSWTVAEAKAKLSEVIDKARHEGPQAITRNGKSAVVVVDAALWARKQDRKGNLADFLLNSPLRDSGLDVTRLKDGPREIDL
jgi:prevent-host-death family protein